MNHYKHQTEGIDWLAAGGIGLLDEQGMGKTITAIEAWNRIRHRTGIAVEHYRTLIICPSVVLWNWAAEWETWSRFPDEVQVIEGAGHAAHLEAPDKVAGLVKDFLG